jgi:nucleotide-binding universal stress UspA family protein
METAAGKVVVGLDGSDASIEALRLALQLAPVLDAPVHAVYCWEIPTVYAVYTEAGYAPYEEAARQDLDRVLTQVFGQETPASVTAELVHGHAAEVLTEAGSQARMLVVGRRGHGGFRGLHLGSVSSACVTHAQCPVLVVHEGGQPGSDRRHERERGSRSG